MQFPEVNDVIWWLGAIYGTCFAIACIGGIVWLIAHIWGRALFILLGVARVTRIVEIHYRRATRQKLRRKRARQAKMDLYLAEKGNQL